MTQIHRELGKRRQKSHEDAEIQQLADVVARRNVLVPQKETR